MEPEFDRALKLAEGLRPTPSNLVRLGSGFGDEMARKAFAQWELRARAAAKFALARSMFFTREALEQASHEAVARFHASLFPRDVPVVDLTVGIGGDLIALAARGPARGFELDSERAEMAARNLQVHGLSASIQQEDSLLWLYLAEGAFAFADPSRRLDGNRTLDPSKFSPDPLQLAAHAERQKLLITKLSPLLQDSLLESLGPRLLFVSYGRECREVLVVAGTETTPGRRAVRADDGESLDASAPRNPVGDPSSFLFDADPAAVRAHALGSLCERFGILPLADSNGYLTGDIRVASPWLATYRVLYAGPGDLKRTKAELRKLGAATPELKQRGAGCDLLDLRRQLRCDGPRALSVAIYPQAKSLRHAILERVPNP
jgi:hypothetical protein